MSLTVGELLAIEAILATSRHTRLADRCAEQRASLPMPPPQPEPVEPGPTHTDLHTESDDYR